MPPSSSGGPAGAVDLHGRTALITGGAVRVGRAISFALAHAGARVVIHYNASEEPAERAAGEIRGSGGKAEILQADLASIDEVKRLASEAADRFGPIDILVNNASIFPEARFADVDPGLWDDTIAINLRAPFFLTQILGGRMKESGGGVIVNMADLAGLQPWNAYAAHAISKAGLVHLTKIAARALAPEVRVVAIAPGTILPPENLDESQIQELADRAPLQRIGSPDDAVGAVLYLIGADFVTGEVLVVDGGRMLK
jgi:NAD(P)-dependent dehydrogenase (short-subunit alcohol dehydrogenase family)